MSSVTSHSVAGAAAVALLFVAGRLEAQRMAEQPARFASSYSAAAARGLTEPESPMFIATAVGVVAGASWGAYTHSQCEQKNICFADSYAFEMLIGAILGGGIGALFGYVIEVGQRRRATVQFMPAASANLVSVRVN